MSHVYGGRLVFGQVDGTAQVWTSGLMDKLSETFKSLARRVEAAVRSRQAQISVRLLRSQVVFIFFIFFIFSRNVILYVCVRFWVCFWFLTMHFTCFIGVCVVFRWVFIIIIFKKLGFFEGWICRDFLGFFHYCLCRVWVFFYVNFKN